MNISILTTIIMKHNLGGYCHVAGIQFVPTIANLTCQQNKSKSHVQESISDTTKAFYLSGNPSI